MSRQEPEVDRLTSRDADLRLVQVLVDEITRLLAHPSDGVGLIGIAGSAAHSWGRVDEEQETWHQKLVEHFLKDLQLYLDQT